MSGTFILIAQTPTSRVPTTENRSLNLHACNITHPPIIGEEIEIAYPQSHC